MKTITKLTLIIIIIAILSSVYIPIHEFIHFEMAKTVGIQNITVMWFGNNPHNYSEELDNLGEMQYSLVALAPYLFDILVMICFFIFRIFGGEMLLAIVAYLAIEDFTLNIVWFVYSLFNYFYNGTSSKNDFFNTLINGNPTFLLLTIIILIYLIVRFLIEQISKAKELKAKIKIEREHVT